MNFLVFFANRFRYLAWWRGED